MRGRVSESRPVGAKTGVGASIPRPAAWAFEFGPVGAEDRDQNCGGAMQKRNFKKRERGREWLTRESSPRSGFGLVLVALRIIVRNISMNPPSFCPADGCRLKADGCHLNPSRQ